MSILSAKYLAADVQMIIEVLTIRSREKNAGNSNRASVQLAASSTQSTRRIAAYSTIIHDKVIYHVSRKGLPSTTTHIWDGDSPEFIAGVNVQLKLRGLPAIIWSLELEATCEDQTKAIEEWKGSPLSKAEKGNFILGFHSKDTVGRWWLTQPTVYRTKSKFKGAVRLYRT